MENLHLISATLSGIILYVGLCYLAYGLFSEEGIKGNILIGLGFISGGIGGILGSLEISLTLILLSSLALSPFYIIVIYYSVSIVLQNSSNTGKDVREKKTMSKKKIIWFIALVVLLFIVPILLISSFIALQENDESEKFSWQSKYSYEELKKIAQKEHDPELEIEELKIFSNPGMYEVKTTLRFGKEKPIKVFRQTAKIKYVNSKFVVRKYNFSEGLNQWSINTYNEKCDCYRSWKFKSNEDQISSVDIGNQVNDSRSIGLTSYLPKSGNIVNYIYTYSDKGWEANGSAFKNGQYNFGYRQVATYKKPLEEKEEQY